MPSGRPRRLSTHLVFDRYVNLELYNKKQRVLANGCWEWTGIKNNAGYGFIGFIYAVSRTGRRDAGMMTAHRLAFMLAHDRAPHTRNVNHICHNKLCVNPAHLIEGTQQEKMAAMRADGIKLGCPPPGPRGSYNRKQNREYKYTEEHIQWMRVAPVEEIMAKLDLSRIQAVRKQWGFRKGYRWLACPAYERRKTGRARKAAK